MKAGTSRNSVRDDDARENLSDFVASRPVLLSVATFLGAGWLWLIGPENDSVLAALQPYTPAVTSLAGSSLAGLIIGRIARRKLKHVLIAGCVVVVAVSLLTKFGVIGPAADQWVQSSVGWGSEQLDKMLTHLQLCTWVRTALK